MGNTRCRDPAASPLSDYKDAGYVSTSPQDFDDDGFYDYGASKPPWLEPEYESPDYYSAHAPYYDSAHAPGPATFDADYSSSGKRCYFDKESRDDGV